MAAVSLQEGFSQKVFSLHCIVKYFYYEKRKKKFSGEEGEEGEENEENEENEDPALRRRRD